MMAGVPGARWQAMHDGVIGDIAAALDIRAGVAEIGLAGLLAIALPLVAMAIGRRLKPALVQGWTRRFGGDGTLMPRVVRHGLAVLLLGAAQLWPWSIEASLILGLPLASSSMLLVASLLRGVAMPRWVASGIGAFVFLAVLAFSLGGVAQTSDALDLVGFSIGKRRLSLLGLLSIAATCVALYAAIRVVNRLVAHSIGRTQGFDPAQKLLAQKLAAIGIAIIAFFVGIDLLGIDLTAFAVFSGALGLAVGFGLQKTFGNLIAGIILLMDRSIKPGDVIVVGAEVGVVNRIGVRAVSVITRDGKEHLIPNENLMTQEVENWSFSDRNVRVRIPVAIAYRCDIDLAQQLMLDAAIESPRVLRSPKPNVWLKAFGENGLEHEILVWISDPEGGIGNVRSDVLNRLWRMFKAHGIAIPYPQREVRMVSDSPGPTPPEAEAGR